MEKEWHFDFGVYALYPITEKQATEFMEAILELAEERGFSVGGGPRLYEEADDGQDAECD